jgi:hypothetical protein
VAFCVQNDQMYICLLLLAENLSEILKMSENFPAKSKSHKIDPWPAALRRGGQQGLQVVAVRAGLAAVAADGQPHAEPGSSKHVLLCSTDHRNLRIRSSMFALGPML